MKALLGFHLRRPDAPLVPVVFVFVCLSHDLSAHPLYHVINHTLNNCVSTPFIMLARLSYKHAFLEFGARYIYMGQINTIVLCKRDISMYYDI